MQIHEFVDLEMKLLSESRPSRSGSAFLPVRIGAIIATFGLFLTSGCATPHAVLQFAAPSTATAGSSFTITVTAMINGRRDTLVNSYISFTSSDPSAVLPGLYRFTPSDAGSHTWTNSFTLMTPGDQTISATIYDASGINGSATVAVSP